MHYQTYDENEVLLDPVVEELERGEYPLGVIFYGQENSLVFGIREE